jgi:hypothetical protein
MVTPPIGGGNLPMINNLFIGISKINIILNKK